jgi:hypothetical protein
MLKLGSNGLMVAAWQSTMLRRYPTYTKGLDGLPLKRDRYFGADEQAIQREYQKRTGQPQTGEVSDGDLHYLGLLPTLLSIHGTGQPDPFGIGYPADIARRCLDLYWWQPVGNYEAAAVPMNHSADHGEAEAARLVTDPVITPGPVAFADYSQGSICGGRVRNRMRAGKLRGELMAAVSFGNPMRPAGSYAGNRDPGGHGIDPTEETASEPFCLNLAAKGDLYTTCPDGKVGEMERAIFNAVFEKWFGRDTITEQFFAMFIHPIAAIKAAWRGIVFALKGTGPHIRYHIDECPGTGMTYYEYAIKHLRDTATARLERLAAE